MRTSHRRSNRPEEKTATRFQKTLRRYTPIKRRNTPIPRRLGATRIEKETRFGHQRNRPLSARYGDAQANVRKNGRRRDETVDGPTDGVDGVLVWGWGAQGIFKIAKLYANTTNRTPPYRAEARQEGFLQGRKKGGRGARYEAGCVRGRIAAFANSIEEADLSRIAAHSERPPGSMVVKEAPLSIYDDRAPYGGAAKTARPGGSWGWRRRRDAGLVARRFAPRPCGIAGYEGAYRVLTRAHSPSPL